MPKRVAKIDAVFAIDGVGTVIVIPQEGWSIDVSEKIYSRERIRIRTPAGEQIMTYIKAAEMIRLCPEKGGVCFSLPGNIAAESIAPGSELWLERDETEPLLEE